jgi:beta-lactamase regulating signal transducer with metallopeptidase domain
MIIAVIGYGLMVSALAAFAAWLVERAQVAAGRPRKHAWMGGILAALLVPALVIGLREPGEGVVSMLVSAVQTQVQGAATPAVMALSAASPGGEANGGSLDDWLAALWALTSAVLVGAYAFSAWRLGRRARSWRSACVDSSPVSIAPDIGPAVFGWLRSRVVFPHWLIEAPVEVQRLALAHEREHLAARDPQVLTVAMLLGALLPWNLPLLWMLRRLRFAMEVDCDARVVRRGADPNDYGLALLYVSERQSRAPITAIALIERTSQLERRINFMFATPRKYSAVIAGVCFALAGSCLYAAATLDAPRLATAAPVLKPPPGADGPGFRLGQRFEVLLREKYPELLDVRIDGTAIVVAVVNEDWSIERSAKIQSPESIENIKPGKDIFGVLGLTAEEVPYVGAMNMQRRADVSEFVLILYTERNKPGKKFISRIFPDNRALDRAIYEQHFQAGDPVVAGGMPWVLLDRNGKVLRRGIETVKSERWDQAMERRFPGIDAQEVTITEITDDAGEPRHDVAGGNLHMHTIWLAPDSPAPRN